LYKPISILLAVLFLFVLTGLVTENASAYQLIWSDTSDDPGIQKTSIVEDEGDYIYVCGYIFTEEPLQSSWYLERRHRSDGALDWSETDIHTNPARAYSIDVDSEYIYVCGDDSDLGDRYWRVEKRNRENGEIIWEKMHQEYASTAYAVKEDGDYIYVGGSRRIEKRNKSDGEIVVEREPGDGGSLYSVTTDQDYVYACGSCSTGWLVEKRNKEDLSEVWSKNLLLHDEDSFTARDIAVDESYVYIVGGRYSLSVHIWRIEKRSKVDGSLVWLQEPVQTEGGAPTIAYSVAADDDYIYVTGLGSDRGEWTIEKRNKSDGEPVWKVIEELVRTPKLIIASYDDYLYIAGAKRVEKRSKIPYVDIGLRVYNQNAEPVAIAAEPQGTLTSPLRIAADTDNNGTAEVWGIVLVDPGDPMDSGVKIRTGSGDIKALRKFE